MDNLKKVWHSICDVFTSIAKKPVLVIGFMILLSIALIFGGHYSPDSFNSLGVALSLVSAAITIFTGWFTYWAWFNTQELIARHQGKKLIIDSGDVIIAVSISHQTINIEQNIKESKKFYSDLGKIIDSDRPIDVGTNEDDGILTPNHKLINLVISGKGGLGRGFLIKGGTVPFSNKQQMSGFLNEFNDCMTVLYDTIARNNCKKIHLFISAPVEISGLIMPYFTNKYPVFMYHWESKENRYYYIGPADMRQNNSVAK